MRDTSKRVAKSFKGRFGIRDSGNRDAKSLRADEGYGGIEIRRAKRYL
ncbi:hypothetical protein VCRLGP7_180186 [Vibrio crassostreae]|nr:hypothetical protein VCRLGP7_180186 [Vibrio crassostreae]CDT36042.1 hypothetical protein VCRLGP107_520014 [Vibrio crassostreae]